MKLCHLFIPLAIFIGLTTSVRGPIAIISNDVSSTDASKEAQLGGMVNRRAKKLETKKRTFQEEDALLRWPHNVSKSEFEPQGDKRLIETEQVNRLPMTVEGAKETREADLLKPGVVVEKFDDEFSGAKKAGLREGDVLLYWFRGKASGKLESPFDVSLVTTDQLPRGPVKFGGLRGNEKRVWTITKEYWGAKTRPNFSGAALVAYREAMKMAEHGRPIAATDRWRVVANDSQRSRFPWLISWFVGEAAKSLANTQHWKESDDAYQEAILQSEPAGTAVRAQLLLAWGIQLYVRSDLDQAEECFDRALKDSLEADAGNLTGDVLANLGLVAKVRGNLNQADEYFSRSLEIRRTLEPERLSTGEALLNRGMTFFDRGDLAAAEQYFRQALAIYENKGPHSVGTAFILNDLGEVAGLRGDLDGAEQYLRRSLALESEIDPGTSGHATILKTLAKVLEEHGNRLEAEKYMRQSIAIQLKLAPGSADEADARQSFGNLAQRRSDFTTAERAYLQALAIREKIAPEGLDAAETLHSLGDVVLARGDLGQCKSYYQRALAIREKLAPKSADHANTLAALAGIAKNEGQFGAAISFYEQALSAWESQTAQLGGAADVRSAFRSRFGSYYRDYVNLLVMQKQPDLAFQVMERSRARTLLETLAEGHVDIRKGVDASLLKQERSLQADIAAKSDRRIRLLGEKHTDEQIAAINKEINDLVVQHQDVNGRVRASSPAYAALTQPQPLTAKQAQQQLLNDDTLLLEYSLGEERSFVFAVTPSSLVAYELPKRAEIERAARPVYDILIARNRIVKGETEAQSMRRLSAAEAQYPHASMTLSRMILGPVTQVLQRKRLLIVSDGVLQYLPFAALPSPDDLASFTPLVVNHEIVSLPSASVLDVLRKESFGRARPPKTVAVLADPVFDARDVRVRNRQRVPVTPPATTSRNVQQAADSPTSGSALQSRVFRSASEVGAVGKEMIFSRLFFSRQEADAILKQTSPGQGMKALDFTASRATATNSNLAEYRIVHFATHGLLNSEHPELSGLVLSLVDQQGKAQAGFLDLADIYNLNLPVDMVVLSACETGLGKEIKGEGLVGLTRGFMYAGAARVVASLWKVDDAATAELMSGFYKGILQDGLQPVECSLLLGGVRHAGTMVILRSIAI